MAGLIVTDLDGTLLGRDGRVSPRNRAALRAAHDAGWHVAIATGRTWAESHRATDCVAEDALFIGVSGAVLHEAGSGRVLDKSVLPPATALELAHAIVGHGHRAHLLLDAEAAGHDYVFLGSAPLDAATTWWLSEHPVESRDWHAAPEDAHAAIDGMVLRVGTVGPTPAMAEVVRDIEARWGGALAVRAWSALVSEGVVGTSTQMLEVFATAGRQVVDGLPRRGPAGDPARRHRGARRRPQRPRDDPQRADRRRDGERGPAHRGRRLRAHRGAPRRRRGRGGRGAPRGPPLPRLAPRRGAGMTAGPAEITGRWNHPLLRAEGTALLSAHQAIVKGVVESELEVDAVVGPRQVPFEPVFAMLGDPDVARTLAAHRVTVTDSVDAVRAVSLAARAASEGKRVLALVPNEQLGLAR